MIKSALVNTRIIEQFPLKSADQLAIDIPETEKERKNVAQGRKIVENILDGNDDRIFIVVGPCSIHDTQAAKEYARKLQQLSVEVKDKMILIMRCYFEKPRTTTGWKGLCNDPHLDGSSDINHGLRLARDLLKYNADLGLYSGTEYLSTVTPQYFGEYITWACIGARTSESQEHRSLASGLSVPVGFKNGTAGDIDVAVNAVLSSATSHTFQGATTHNSVAIFKTSGNPYSHIVLRGGKVPNYSLRYVASAQKKLKEKNLSPALVIDCSHGNSQKDPLRQKEVFLNVLGQIRSGNTGIKGLMIESNLIAGAQAVGDPKKIAYGISITDSCLGWEDTKSLIKEGYRMLSLSKKKTMQRRRAKHSKTKAH